MTTKGHNERDTFETIVKRHVDTGADVHTAFGKAIEEDPEAYGQYLKRQKDRTVDGNMTDGEAMEAMEAD